MYFPYHRFLIQGLFLLSTTLFCATISCRCLMTEGGSADSCLSDLYNPRPSRSCSDALPVTPNPATMTTNSSTSLPPAKAPILPQIPSPSQAQAPASFHPDNNQPQRRNGREGNFGPRNNQSSRRHHKEQRRPKLANDEAMAESTAIRAPSSRKGQTSITHLMNFALPPRPQNHFHSHHNQRARRNPTWGLGSGYHADDKARYDGDWLDILRTYHNMNIGISMRITGSSLIPWAIIGPKLPTQTFISTGTMCFKSLPPLNHNLRVAQYACPRQWLHGWQSVVTYFAFRV